MHLKNTLYRKHKNRVGTGSKSRVSNMSEVRRDKMVLSKADRKGK